LVDGVPPLVRAGLRAIHEAFGIPRTPCAQLNRVLMDYPDAYPEAVEQLLAEHDAAECECYRKRVPV